MIRGVVTVALLLGNLLLFGMPVALGGIVKFAVQFTAPRSRLRTRVIVLLASIAERWAAGNDRIIEWMLPTRWEIEGIPSDLRPEGHYLLVSNHQSWADILVLFRAFHRRMAFPRFFMKRQLIWFPIVGQGCWALEFPFMQRYTPEYLQKHPEKRGKDLETTRRACQRYRHVPVAIANFVEGTRFSTEKHDDQDSPYRHLLRPRVGGISYVLASLGDQLDAVFDVTIAYQGEPAFWRFVTGDMNTIRVHVRRLEPHEEFFTRAITVPGPERERFKSWIEQVWREKDQLLDRMLPTAV